MNNKIYKRKASSIKKKEYRTCKQQKGSKGITTDLIEIKNDNKWLF